MYSTAYRSGQAAFEFGAKPESCPYYFESEEYADWMDGFFDEMEAEESAYSAKVYEFIDSEMGNENA